MYKWNNANYKIKLPKTQQKTKVWKCHVGHVMSVTAKTYNYRQKWYNNHKLSIVCDTCRHLSNIQTQQINDTVIFWDNFGGITNWRPKPCLFPCHVGHTHFLRKRLKMVIWHWPAIHPISTVHDFISDPGELMNTKKQHFFHVGHGGIDLWYNNFLNFEYKMISNYLTFIRLWIFIYWYSYF